MGFFDIFKIKQFKQQNEYLNSECIRLSNEISSLTAKLNEIGCEEYEQTKEKICQMNEHRDSIEDEIQHLQQDLDFWNKEIQCRKDQVYDLDDAIMFQSVALYTPKYDLMRSEDYKIRLTAIRQQQKDLIKDNLAVTGSLTWTVNGDKRQGTKMVKDTQKLLLRAFNSECDSVIEKVKYNSYEAAMKKIDASMNAITKLGKIMDISITPEYYRSKCDELVLALEYQIKKQAEKDEQKALRAQMREEARLAREIEEARRKVEKELSHYQKAMDSLEKQIAIADETQLAELQEKKAELQASLSDAERAIKDIDYREANQKAGYVYVISNVGSFGENVYKIGMTRRLEPMDRIDELGDASVPFDFDVHAMIFSDNAPALEAALHRAFEDRKLNMVNTRREFFNVTLDEIKAVVKANYDKTAEFIDVADAEQYRRSLQMKSELNAM